MSSFPVSTGFGSFNWNQLNVTDLEKATAFYSGLFGWRISSEMGMVLGHLDGPPFVSFLPIPEGTPHAHSHWLGYVWTEDLDRSHALALQLGATCCVPPTPIPGIGRFAVHLDPRQGLFALYEQAPPVDPNAPMPSGPGHFCYHERMTRDPGAVIPFYRSLFGWDSRTVAMGDGSDYTGFQRGEESIAALMDMRGPIYEGVPEHWLAYVEVTDVDISAARARELGGTVLAQPEDIPGVGRFAVFQDPCGGVLGVIKPG